MFVVCGEGEGSEVSSIRSCRCAVADDMCDSDPNCGHNYKMAVDDFLLGGMRGCTRENPDLPVVKPTGEPVCV